MSSVQWCPIYLLSREKACVYRAITSTKHLPHCSGVPQGKLIKRQRIPRDELGRLWHWKDLNFGIDVTFYGKVFHIFNCDKFTAVSGHMTPPSLSCDCHMIQDFMEGEGIELAAPEPLPSDPYTQSRHLPTHSYHTPSTYDKLSQFLEMDRHVLRFFCVWDDRDCMFGDMRPYVRPRPFFLTTPPSSAPYRSSIITWWTIQLRLERFMSRMMAEILSLCCSAVRDCRKIANPYLVSPTPHKYIAVFTDCACVCVCVCVCVCSQFPGRGDGGLGG